MEKLANEIVDQLAWGYGSDDERAALFARVLDWLSEGNDDGSSAVDLAMRFDEQKGVLR